MADSSKLTQVQLYGQLIRLTPGSVAHELVRSKALSNALDCGLPDEKGVPETGSPMAVFEDQIMVKFGKLLSRILETGEGCVLTKEDVVQVGRMYDQLVFSHARLKVLEEITTRLSNESKEVNAIARQVYMMMEKEKRVSRAMESKYQKLAMKDKKGRKQDKEKSDSENELLSDGSNEELTFAPGVKKACAHCKATQTSRWVSGHVAYQNQLVCNSCDHVFRSQGSYPTLEQIRLRQSQQANLNAIASNPAMAGLSGRQGMAAAGQYNPQAAAAMAAHGANMQQIQQQQIQQQAAERQRKQKSQDNWVQCDECKKWRRIKDNIDPESLPDKWICKMNTWDANFARCTAAQEVTDNNNDEEEEEEAPKKSRQKTERKRPTAAKPRGETKTVKEEAAPSTRKSQAATNSNSGTAASTPSAGAGAGAGAAAANNNSNVASGNNISNGSIAAAVNPSLPAPGIHHPQSPIANQSSIVTTLLPSTNLVSALTSEATSPTAAAAAAAAAAAGAAGAAASADTGAGVSSAMATDDQAASNASQMDTNGDADDKASAPIAEDGQNGDASADAPAADAEPEDGTVRKRKRGTKE